MMLEETITGKDGLSDNEKIRLEALETLYQKYDQMRAITHYYRGNSGDLALRQTLATFQRDLPAAIPSFASHTPINPLGFNFPGVSNVCSVDVDSLEVYNWLSETFVLPEDEEEFYTMIKQSLDNTNGRNR